MKILLSSCAFILFSVALTAQSNSLLGQWNGVIGEDNLTMVFAQNGRVVWKIARTWNMSSGECSCSFTVSTPVTWRLKNSGTIQMSLGVATGSMKMLRNNAKYPETVKLNWDMCDSILGALKFDYSNKKYTDEILL